MISLKIYIDFISYMLSWLEAKLKVKFLDLFS